MDSLAGQYINNISQKYSSILKFGPLLGVLALNLFTEYKSTHNKANLQTPALQVLNLQGYTVHL